MMESLNITSSKPTLSSGDEIQTWLVTQLSQRLDIDPDDIDISESFDSYGLQSVDALALITKLEQELGITLSPTVLWNYPTIEALSERLEEDL